MQIKNYTFKFIYIRMKYFYLESFVLEITIKRATSLKILAL